MNVFALTWPRVLFINEIQHENKKPKWDSKLLTSVIVLDISDGENSKKFSFGFEAPVAVTRRALSCSVSSLAPNANDACRSQAATDLHK